MFAIFSPNSHSSSLIGQNEGHAYSMLQILWLVLLLTNLIYKHVCCVYIYTMKAVGVGSDLVHWKNIVDI